MKEKTKELADSVGAVYPTLLLGRHDGVLFTETELETFVELVAADELRRLHKVNAELLEALKDATEGLEIASAGGGVDFYAYAKTSRAAINKAEGEMK
jgi:hypothetical protein